MVCKNMNNSKNCYILFSIFLLIGVLFYDIIEKYTGFSYADELMALIFGFYALIQHPFQKIMKEFYICCFVFVAYLIYSFSILLNVSNAILMDFFIQIKPYLIFYFAIMSGFCLTDKYKRILKKMVVVYALIFFPLGFLYLFNVQEIWEYIHPSRYSTIFVILGFIYLYCSSKDKCSIRRSMLIWAIGLLSVKGKMFGFYLSAFFIFYILGRNRIKISFKYLLLGCLFLGGIWLICREKIMFYFIEGSQADVAFGRPALYIGAVDILSEYFPFGSGFGTYGTFASDMYFSPIYIRNRYLLNSQIGDGLFISDAFYPSLAQYGYVGILLFLVFWKRRIKDANFLFSRSHIIEYKCLLLIIIYFAIECTSDSTFVQNRGMMIMLLMAMFINEGNSKYKSNLNFK